MAIIEAEQIVLDVLCHENQAAVDVGAHIGHYVQMLCKNNNTVYAYEPVYELYCALKKKFGRCDKIHISQKALSDKDEEAFLYIPTFDQVECTALSSCCNKYEHAERVRTVSVKTTKLDNEINENIRFIKIDVEGYEYEVVKGAIETIVKYKPNLLIELEERHRKGTVHKVTELLYNLDYNGYYINLENYRLETIDVNEVIQKQNTYTIDDKKDAKINSNFLYINNFIFVSKQSSEYFVDEINQRMPQLKLWHRIVKANF